MNILLDLSGADPAGGGVSTVCRWFASRLATWYPEHAFWSSSYEQLRRPFSRIHDADEGIRIIEGMVHHLNTSHAQTRDVYGIKGFYRKSALMAPMLHLWRAFAPFRLAGQRQREDQWYAEAANMFAANCRLSGIDVIHCPYQSILPRPPYHLATIPYIMNLHDLQHEHFPEFFTPAELQWRRNLWYTSARCSRFVVAAAKHVREDIIRYIGIEPDKVPLIPWGVPFEGEPLPTDVEMREVAEHYSLPAEFILYPAVTWRHKNHDALLKAVATLRSVRGLAIHVVLTGGRGPYHDQVLGRVRDLGLEEFVHHLGLITLPNLKALYRLAVAVVVPSLHEQTSGPIMEAMVLGCPVAGGAIADHQELLAEDAGLLFDPSNVNDIAECVSILWLDRARAQAMAGKAKKRINTIRSWKTWAESYMELYRICAEERVRGCGKT